MTRNDATDAEVAAGAGAGAAAPMEVFPGAAAAALGEALAALRGMDAAARLWKGDPRLYTPDAAHDKSIATRLGWLRAPETYRPRLAELRALAAAVRADGLRAAVLLGMGGSSLCAEVLARTFGAAPGGAGIPVHVLDSTDPDAVRAAEAASDPRETLYLVASKSGGTLEVKSFEAHFWERLAAAPDRARHFVAITDPGTGLAAQARARGYRAVLENDPNIGGRYSALSLFGLFPAALLGVDLEALLDSAAAMAAACREPDPETNPGLHLGALLGGGGKTGRDKLAFFTTRELAGFPGWVEQLVAESTGKEGRGIAPVNGTGAPFVDAVEMILGVAGESAEKVARLSAEHRALDVPHAAVRLAAAAALGGEFFRWEVATAIAGALLQVNPFDEPNVTEAKNETAAFLAGRSAAAADIARRTFRPDDAEVLRAHLASARPGDYLAFTAFFQVPGEEAPARGAALHAARVAAQKRLPAHNATVVSVGPRFLHSTGQLHKGGPNTGVFVQLVAPTRHDLPIPGEAFTFGQLLRAQADGDLAVLLRRGRRALRVDLGAAASVEEGLAALARSFEGA
ncbi:MAG TPA: glucose-6-phosphate isomerase [Myxococcota bacterium]|nr:glucose-6-phosphate isomerase [Myxococcota bacterium]